MKRVSFVSLSLLVTVLSIVLAGAAGPGASIAQGQSLSPKEREIAGRVRAETIREITVALADKEMEGRGTAQPGGEKAAKYIADRFRRMGLNPLGGDQGTFLQTLPFQRDRVSPDSTLKIDDHVLKWGTEFVYLQPDHADKDASEAQGDLVCLNVGQAPAGSKTADLPPLDLKGKIAVILLDAPDSGDSFLFACRRAAGVIMAFDSPALPPHLAKIEQQSRLMLAEPPRRTMEYQVPIAYVTRPVAEKLFAKSPRSYADTLAMMRSRKQFSLELGQKAEFSRRVTRERLAAHNVVGLLEGADARLKDEAVVYSAHYDAYGKDADGRVRPGAADNALGMAKMLALAEALAQSPDRPRRSVVFLAPTAEEMGMVGSRYWVQHPTWPVAKIAANLNLDGIDTDTYGPVRYIVGSGLGHSSLDGMVGEVARDLQLRVLPDLDVASRSYYRSDQIEFARMGVPTIYVFPVGVKPQAAGASSATGGLLGQLAGLRSTAEELTDVIARTNEFLAKHYHQPSDVIRPDWDWEGVRTAAVFYLVAGLRVANAEKMPTWLPGSPYNHARGERAGP